MGEKFLAALIWTTTLAEALSLFLVQYGISSIVYHIYNPIELLLLSLFFGSSVPTLGRHRRALGLAALSAILALCNAVFLQPATAMNTHFLLLEAAIIIIYCLLALRELLLHASEPVLHYRLFWFTCLLLVYWSLTFTGWGLFELFASEESTVHRLFYQVLSSANFVLYGGIAIVLINHKKLIPSGV